VDLEEGSIGIQGVAPYHLPIKLTKVNPVPDCDKCGAVGQHSLLTGCSAT
jgi:hypothetical protein